VGSRAGLDGCGKSHCQLGFDPWTVQPIVITVTTTLSWPTIPAVQIAKLLFEVVKLERIIFIFFWDVAMCRYSAFGI